MRKINLKTFSTQVAHPGVWDQQKGAQFFSGCQSSPCIIKRISKTKFRFSRSTCCDLLVMSAHVPEGEGWHKEQVFSLHALKSPKSNPSLWCGSCHFFLQVNVSSLGVGAGFTIILCKPRWDVSLQYLGTPYSCQLLGYPCTGDAYTYRHIGRRPYAYTPFICMFAYRFSLHKSWF